MRHIGKAIGALAAALGVGVVLFGLFALADPAGAQLSNDSDPFGAPPSTIELLLHLAAGIALLGIGLWLITRRPRT